MEHETGIHYPDGIINKYTKYKGKVGIKPRNLVGRLPFSRE